MQVRVTEKESIGGRFSSRSSTRSSPFHHLNFLFPFSLSEDDTIGDLKKLVAAQTGTRPDKIRIQKWHNVFKVRDERGGRGGGGGGGREKGISTCGGPLRPSLSTTRTTHTSSSLQDHITLADYEIHDGMGLELYYN